MQSIFLRGREQAERPIESETIHIRAGRFHVADQPMKLDEPEQSSQFGGRFAADIDLDADGLEQDRLGERDVVALEQQVRADRFEMHHPLLALEVCEQAAVDFLGRHVQVTADGGEDSGPVERPGGTSRFRGAEDDLAKLFRRMPGDGLELAAIFEKLGQSLLDERERSVAERGGDVVLNFAARVRFLAVKDFEQLLGHRDVSRVIDGGIGRDDPVADKTDADEGAG